MAAFKKLKLTDAGNLNVCSFLICPGQEGNCPGEEVTMYLYSFVHKRLYYICIQDETFYLAVTLEELELHSSDTRDE